MRRCAHCKHYLSEHWYGGFCHRTASANGARCGCARFVGAIDKRNQQVTIGRVGDLQE